jgi:putative acetyltransferase
MTMDYSTDYETQAEAIAELFASTFTASEGAEEGALIGALARRLIAETPAEDLRVFTAWENGALSAASSSRASHTRAIRARSS